jgi:hypothetical protein
MSRVRDLASILTASSSMATDTEVSAVSAQIPTNVAGKNFVINGGMDITQRGTTLNGVQGYNLDRWVVNGFGTTNNYSVSQLLVSGIIPGIRWYQRIASTTTNVQNFWLSQSIETNEVIKFAGQTVTLSFYYRMPTNNFTNAWTVNTIYSTGTDANLHYPAASTTITAENLSNTIYWTRYTKTFFVPATATSFAIMLNSTNSIVNSALFDITGVQLEIGSVATPFSRAGGTIQGELALCQRYYYRAGGEFSYPRLNSTTNYPFFGTAVATSSTQAYGVLSLPVPMRTYPSSLDLLSAGSYRLLTGNANYTLSGIALDGSYAFASTTTVGLGFSTSGLTTNNFYYVVGNFAPTAYIGVSAEI